jgi:hypothetical protein
MANKEQAEKLLELQLSNLRLEEFVLSLKEQAAKEELSYWQMKSSAKKPSKDKP